MKEDGVLDQAGQGILWLCYWIFFGIPMLAGVAFVFFMVFFMGYLDCRSWWSVCQVMVR